MPEFKKLDACDVNVPSGTGMCGRGFKTCEGTKCKYYLPSKYEREIANKQVQLAEMEKQHATLGKKIEALKAEINPKGGAKLTAEDLDGMNKDELLSAAKDVGAEVDPSMKKDDIKAAILAKL